MPESGNTIHINYDRRCPWCGAELDDSDPYDLVIGAHAEECEVYQAEQR
jgi:hypothetical protein